MCVPFFGSIFVGETLGILERTRLEGRIQGAKEAWTADGTNDKAVDGDVYLEQESTKVGPRVPS
jgi:hypothetical protein